MKKNKSFFGLPEDVKFCKKCVESNQRFLSSTQHKMNSDEKKETIFFDKNGICGACNYYENKKKIDWVSKEKNLRYILEKHRSKNGKYDVLVPGSGGKDSVFQSYTLKYKYKMNPLTVTWAPHLYTDIGWKNFQSWINTGGFDNYLFTPNGKVHRYLTRQSTLNILHPFQPFIL